MMVCLDVAYWDGGSATGCVGFASWVDPSPALELVVRRGAEAAPYRPGELYKRELPCLLGALGRLDPGLELETAVVDGHVWLEPGRAGLGAHLHEALGGAVPVVGVAKGAFLGGAAVPVLRGRSRRPLFVTAVGLDPGRAAELVRSMHGSHRIPTLLKRADGLARAGRPQSTQPKART